MAEHRGPRTERYRPRQRGREGYRARAMSSQRGSSAAGRTLRVVPALAEPGPFPHHIPALLDPTVGRDETVVEGLQLLAAGHRLITITGPGGVGKTRLAVELAVRALAAFERAVLFVPLAALHDPALVLPTVAATAGFDALAERPPLDVVAEGLAGRNAVLVLDNLEHLMSSRPELEALLGRCPQLRIVATSRQALRLSGEVVVDLQPLDKRAATELLIREVRRFDPEFGLDVHTAAPIAEICRRLDGLPLAIELAAARLRLLAPAELVRLLGRQLDLLRSNRRDAPPHQQTLRATIAWSYRLLSPDEQRTLRWLSVFAGGCTVDGIATVMGVDRFDVLDRLDALVAHHLVRIVATESSEGRRFELLESIREFAAEELRAAGQGERNAGDDEKEPATEAHAEWAQRLVDESVALLTGPDQARGRDRLDSELDNVRAALERRSAQGADDAGLRLVAPMWRYWWLRGLLTEGRAWTGRMIDAYHGEPTAALGRALQAAADLAEEQSDSAAAEQLLARAIAVFERLGDDLGLADCWNSLGMVARSGGALDRAEALHRDAVRVFRAHEEQRRIVSALNSLAMIAYLRGDLPTAEASMREAIEAIRVLGDRRALGQLLGNLGSTIQAQGDAVVAIEHFEESVQIAADLGDAVGEAHSVANLGSALVSAGDLERAGTVLADGMERARQLGNRDIEASALHSLGRLAAAHGDRRGAGRTWLAAFDVFAAAGSESGFADCVETIAGLAVDAGRHADAASLLAWAAVRRASDGSAPEGDEETVARDRRAVEAALGAVAVEQLAAEAAAWTPAEARAAAVALVERLPARPQRSTRDASALAAAKRVGITARELDVIDRLAQRRTDQEIASELFVSVRTVTTHVSAVLRKLGVSSRRDVPARAAELGLLPG